MAETPKKAGSLDASPPKIPGVPPSRPKKNAPPKPGAPAAKPKQPAYLWAASGVALLLILVAFVWWIGSTKQESGTISGANAASPAGNSGKKQAVRGSTAVPVAPGVIATTDELSLAWAAKKFIFTEHTGKKIPALVVRLPDNTYWAISMIEPYGSCELAYITNMDELRTEYNFSATHPMVGDPCTHTVFDLAQYGSGPSGEVRGEIVSGTGVRPPLAIEVEVNGTNIVATRAEADILHSGD